MHMINKKLGYYTVDGVEYESKIKACIKASANNSTVLWHFNEAELSNYPWHIEPTQTLDQLYDKRTRDLREKYDYIIISYSGGSDSHNIVSSFLRQGLHIDEIIVNTMEQGSKNFTNIDPNNLKPENAAAEHYLQTIPRLKEIQLASPKTKINVLDLTEYCFKSWLNAGDASWIEDKREGLNPLNVTRFNYLHFSEVRKNFDKGKTIALVLGVEKPRTFIHTNNKFYIRFTDRATNIITIENHVKEYPNAVVEYFYWSPEGTDIMCKQAHVIKRWLEANPQHQSLWFHKNMTAETFRIYHERMLRPLLYTTWNNSWWQADKATKDWYSEFDHWFIHGAKGTHQHDIWLEGINYVTANASKFINMEHGFADGLKIFAYNYPVGEMTPAIDPKKLIN
jgi:hypothetical protein